MTSSLNVFGAGTLESAPSSPYAPFGLEANPFRPSELDVRSGTVPFFREYIELELRQIALWVDDVHIRGQRQPLALVGNIGVGKTLVMGQLVHALRSRASEGVAVDSLVLSDAGYGRISVGSWLVMALDRLELSGVKQASVPDILPLFRRIVQSGSEIKERGRISRVLAHIRDAAHPEELLQFLTTWLRRGYLTAAQSRRLGLIRKLDYEGELIPLVGEIVTLARDAGVFKTLFIFVDQLEDLFSKGLTPQRRSRVLTDLRAFIDVIDAGAPIGLVLTWAPSFDAEIRVQYPAVYSRLHRRRVELPLLEQRFAAAFTHTWMAKSRGTLDPGELSQAAWNWLRSKKQLSQPGDKATPRDLLAALSMELDRRAGVT